MKTDKQLNVFYKDRRVGRMALTQEGKTAFQYDEEWIENGFSISPFSLPLDTRVFVPVKNHFNGMCA